MYYLNIRAYHPAVVYKLLVCDWRNLQVKTKASLAGSAAPLRDM